MRWGIIAFAAVLIAQSSTVRHYFEQQMLPVDEAVAVKCGHLQSDLRDECDERFEARFLDGQLDPMAVLRNHCTRQSSVWDLSQRPAPPQTCVEKFGGWIES